MATEVPEKAAKRRKLQHNSTEASVGPPDTSLTSSIAFLSDTRDRVKLHCYCLKCKSDLGLAVNTWSKISSTHYTPTTQSRGDLDGLETGPKATKSPEGGNLGGCIVQPCLCKNCRDVIGVKCKEAPEGKSQYLGRMFLKLRKMTLDKSPSGLAIEPQIEDTKHEFEEDLYEASPLPSRMSRVRDSKETDGGSALSADIWEDVAWLKAVSAETSVELQAQRRDIDRVSATVRRMERDISQMKDLMERIRSEAITRSTASALSQREGMGYPVEELELLTANITSIGAKVNGIEGLKLEFEMMKRRIKRMEDATNATQSIATLAPFPQPGLRATPVARTTKSPEEPSQRKRTESILPHEEDDESYVDHPETGTPESGPAGRTLSASRSSEGLRENHRRPRSSTLDEPIPNSGRVEPDVDKGSGSGHGGSDVQRKVPNLKHTVSPTFVTPAKRRAPKATEQFFSYEVPVIDNSQDDDYIPHSRSTVVQGASNSPRARGRARGRGSGRRPRTSLNARQYGTPEWEKPDWVDQSGKNEKVTGSTTASKRGGGVSRRGTGGGSYSEPRRAQAQSSVDRTSSQEATEVYRLTPRSARGGRSTIRPREERQRDSEGYLLTAKGTRDGRSKFWKDVGAGLKPNPNFSDDTRAAHSSRHAKIMQQIFPDGVEEGKRRSNLAQQLFSKDKLSNGTNGERGDVGKSKGDLTRSAKS